MENQEMGTRGQTTLDFSIGISVFLGAIIFIFLFAPGILTPFTVTGQSDAVTVDRTADYLAQNALGSPEQPYVLDRGCTVAFFDREATEDPETEEHDCRYANATLTEQVGVAEYRTVNVTIRGNLTGGQQLEQLYWNTTSRNLTTSPPPEDERVELTIGDDLEQRRATTTATRVVTLHGEDVTMRVVVS